MARIFLTGGTGFIGTALMPHLLARGHQLVLLTRNLEAAGDVPPEVKVIVGDPLKPGPWWDEVAECDGAVNLAGSQVMGRWSPTFKATIRESRVLPTKNLVAAIPEGKPFVLFSASAVGVYGNGGEKELAEEDPTGSDYLASVAVEWEKEALAAKARGARVVVGRFALVLGRNGGAIEELFRNARSFCSGPLGGGNQWISWIHIEDLVDAITSLFEAPDAEGVYNLCAPEAVRQGELAKAVRERLKTKTALPIPAFLAKMVLGDFAENLLYSQRMSAKKLMAHGFHHRYPDLKENLRTLL